MQTDYPQYAVPVCTDDDDHRYNWFLVPDKTSVEDGDMVVCEVNGSKRFRYCVANALTIVDDDAMRALCTVNERGILGLDRVLAKVHMEDIVFREPELESDTPTEPDVPPECVYCMVPRPNGEEGR